MRPSWAASVVRDGRADRGADGELRGQVLADRFVEQALGELHGFRAPAAHSSPSCTQRAQSRVRRSVRGRCRGDGLRRRDRVTDVSSSRAAVPPPTRNASSGADDAGDHAAARFGQAELGGRQSRRRCRWPAPARPRRATAGPFTDAMIGLGSSIICATSSRYASAVSPHSCCFSCIGQRRGGVHFVHVHAGAERAAGAGEHDRPHALFQVQVAERFAAVATASRASAHSAARAG